MKVAPLHPPSTFGLGAPAQAEPAESQELQEKAKAGQVNGQGPVDPEKLRLAREFEQIFIRKMLSSLEKSGRNAAGGAASASGDAYGSMVVSALAEAVSKGGGVGLAEMIARAASQPTAAGAASSATVTKAVEAAAASVAPATSGVSTAPLSLPAARITVPQNVRITASHPATGATYARPTPAVIFNGNHDIQDSFKDSNR